LPLAAAATGRLWPEKNAVTHPCPTVSSEAVMLMCVVDANENREVTIVDIPNAFVQTVVEDEKDRACIRIRGPLFNILVSIAPDVYVLYVTTGKKGEKQLLVQCLTALYGTMVASLIYILQEVCQEPEVQGI
jgi:hypothetical protein